MPSTEYPVTAPVALAGQGSRTVSLNRARRRRFSAVASFAVRRAVNHARTTHTDIAMTAIVINTFHHRISPAAGTTGAAAVEIDKVGTHGMVPRIMPAA